MTLESQLQASVDLIELRKRDSACLAAVIKGAQAEMQARKAKLRSDVAELAKQRKALQRQAAELSSAGYRVRARVQRKDKGVKKGPRSRTNLYAVIPEDMMVEQMELNALDKARADAEYAAALRDEADSDDYERQNAARGNEP